MATGLICYFVGMFAGWVAHELYSDKDDYNEGYVHGLEEGMKYEKRKEKEECV